MVPLSGAGQDDYAKRQACGCEGCLNFWYDQKAFLHVLHTMDPLEVEAHVELRSTDDKTSCFQSYHDAYWPGCFIQHFPGNQENKNYLRFIEHSRIARDRIENLSHDPTREESPAYEDKVQVGNLLKYIRSFPLHNQPKIYGALVHSAFFRFLKPRDRLGKILSINQLQRHLFRKRGSR